jgi:sigma-B regulation protein RsbU (phosphoserine phosphatase)
MIVLFGVIAGATSILSALTLNKYLTEEYISKGTAISESIASSAVEIILNRDASTTQSIIDQYMESSGVSYVYVIDNEGSIISHTFVPGIPEEVSRMTNESDKTEFVAVKMAAHNVIDISSPILAGVMGYVHVGMDKDIIFNRMLSTVLRQQAIILAIFLCSAFLAYYLINRISKPLSRLTAYAKDLVVHDFSTPEEISAEILQLKNTSRDEIGALAESILYMETSLNEYVTRLIETTTAKERIESELIVARQIQMSIVKKTFPPFPQRSEFDIYAVLEPAREVGGDFYDFFLIDDRNLFFIIGDVSGKGVPASLYMAVTRTLIRAMAYNGLQPDQLISRVNQELSIDNESQMFVTLFCGVMDTQTGEILHVNAGHNRPLVMPLADEVTFLETIPGVSIGILEDASFHLGRLVLEPGEILFMYTDGVTEAMNRADELFSKEKLKSIVNTNRDASLEALISTVMLEIESFSNDVPQTDDITMLALRFDGEKS